jgi:hypothetical protein
VLLVDERGILDTGHEASGLTRRDLESDCGSRPACHLPVSRLPGFGLKGAKIAGGRRSHEVKCSRSIATHVDVARRDVEIFHVLEVDGPPGSDADAPAGFMDDADADMLMIGGVLFDFVEYFIEALQRRV